MHQNVECRRCHVKLVFTNVSTRCADCHADMHRGQFGPKCEQCHTVSGWQVNLQAVKGHQNRFPLVGAHAVVPCESCHKGAATGRFTGLSTECASCHIRAFQQTKAPSHTALKFPTACQTCHTMDAWQGAKFDHAQFTGFMLTGVHAKLECAACHAGGRFQGTPSNCFGCHAKDFNATKNPDHVRAGFPQDCSKCHTTMSWQGARFDHNAFTKFPLTGAHASVSCQQCHINGKFTGTSADCASCHTKNFNSTKNPDHKAAGFPTTCTLCHTTSGWQGARFDHNTFTKFPLTGVHASVSCQQCHINGKFTGTPMDCASCHINNFNNAKNPDHKTAGFPTTCATCHNTSGWSGAKFDHSQTGFPLTGFHATLTCSSCHINGKFAGLGKDCASCHINDYNRTTNPNHKGAGFPTTCVTCHNTSAWLGAKFDHNTATKFPLTGFHINVSCQQCHINGKFAGTSTDCASCHINNYNNTTNPNHKAAGFPTNCAVCHTTSQWLGAKFDHSRTRFPLTGFHANVNCSSCHINGRFAGTPTDCASCHINNYNNTKNPDHRAAGFPTNCAVCHTTSQWLGAKFDHSRTAFPLTGFHVSVSCQQCHINGKFAGLGTACANCHLANYNNTTNPSHKAAGFPTTCATCHNTTAWLGAKFDHNTATKFPLTGFHVNVSCQQCHINGRFVGTPADCASCHLTNYNNTTNPNHKTAGFPTTCATCHNTTAWLGAKFDHNTLTKFPLTGFHVNVPCQQCHINGRFAGTPKDCASCHLTNYNNTANPNHKTAGFPTTCATCHNTTGWAGAKFDHNTLTRFPLTGFHVNVSCQQCHINGRFAGTPTDCASCHITNYNNTTSPSHKAAGFPTTCATCHNTSGWAGAKFDHNTATKFPLTGFHTTVSCSSCHINGRFVGTPTDCASCHLANYNNTTSPSHKAAGFPTTCATCHNTTGWAGAKFDHNTLTRFPLTGFHVNVSCQQCHINGKFAGLGTACANCHITNYNNTTNPNHKAAGFPTDCSICHSTSQWLGAKFDHSKTNFPLTGFHVTVSCATCHVNGKFAGLGTACANCHITNYNNTTNPNHKASGFPQQCQVCHSTSAWIPSTFNHNQTRFPLTGAHTRVVCSNCHIGGKFAGTPTDCYSCHKAVYNAVTTPNHIAAGFPTNCSQCHTTTAWTGAKFNHASFPIYSGVHAGKWTTCNDCHVNPTNFTVFSCVTCHAHDKAPMDNKHSGVKNYVYNSSNCYSCHPNGTKP